MADIAITSANTAVGTGVPQLHGTYGETVVAGQFLYLDPADNKFKLADADGASALIRTATHVSLNGGGNGQPATVMPMGYDITIGGTLTAGLVYYLSDTPGFMGILGDVTGGDYLQAIGIASSTSVLRTFANGYSGVAT